MSAQQFYGKPLGYQQLTPTAATALTVPSGARIAIITSETQNTRWRDDGTNPTAAVGQLIKTTDPPFLYDGNLATIKFIETTSAAKVNVCYYG